jgi:(2Fe-2S) ferredoxin
LTEEQVQLIMGAVCFVTRLVVAALAMCECSTAFLPRSYAPRSRVQESTLIFNSAGADADASAALAEAEEIARADAIVMDIDVDPAEARKFKILTCSSTACSKKRTVLGLDEFSTFAAFWSRSQERTSLTVQVEESSCLGSCKQAPCVGILHEDFEGAVGLEGMDPAEFNAKVFQRIISEDDADRVWSSVENAILAMAEEEEYESGEC